MEINETAATEVTIDCEQVLDECFEKIHKARERLSWSGSYKLTIVLPEGIFKVLRYYLARSNAKLLSVTGGLNYGAINSLYGIKLKISPVADTILIY